MVELKNLATCSPREFIRQTAKIRHAVKKWLTLTDILNIHKRAPVFDKDATKEQRAEIAEQQALDNIDAILNAVMDEHPDETIDLLAMCCFIEPEDVDNYTTEDLMGAFTQMIGSRAVIGFFITLMHLGQTFTSAT